ncbi:MAG: N-acetylmuramoyl-L-alanine amidase [Bacteroidota bacterium]|nr:N-acetylmuramoyl-L-alanine amidase [Bacteroidota bacterium]
MKLLLSILNVLLIVLIIPLDSLSQNNGRICTVVIDAGHGGKDPGAVGRNSQEKNIALAIALKTGAYIEVNFTDVKVIYTRKTDKFVELHKRAEIANNNKADFFISIHCNANRSSRPSGTETYVMGLHKSNANLEVAKKENAAILLEDNFNKNYDGFDPSSDEGYISLSLLQNSYQAQSVAMADMVQKQFKERVGLKDRSVRQAGFWVLYKTAMPGVLIETGFLSNAKDEKFLKSKRGQTYISSAIYRAFKEYKQQMERDLPKFESKVKKEVTAEKKQQNESVFLSIQISTSPKKKKINSKNFRNYKEVFEYKHSGVYKYVIGKFDNIDQAHIAQNKMKKLGYKGAFIVAFKNGERISVKQALHILQE